MSLSFMSISIGNRLDTHNVRTMLGRAEQNTVMRGYVGVTDNEW
jgi:hypothetical protein